MSKPKIAIACEGGGSQTAFTAGVLKAVFDSGIHHETEIIAFTGTSGGALNRERAPEAGNWLAAQPNLDIAAGISLDIERNAF